MVAGVFVLVILVAVILGGVGVVRALGRSGQDAAVDPAATAPTTTAQSTGTTTAPPASSGQVTEAANAKPAAACTDAAIAVTASVNKVSFAAGEDPTLTLKVTNTGNTACNVNVGTSQMEFKITSGDDSIFSSKDCQSGSTDLMKNIPAGNSETANFVWQRNRTAPNCAKVTGTPGGDGATYVYTALLGKKASKQILFQLQ